MGILRKFWRKSIFPKILIKIEIFRKSSPKLRLSKTLIKIAISFNFWPKSRYLKNLDFNQDFFLKKRPKSRFLDIWTEIDMFRIKPKCLENYYQTWNFREFWPKSLFFENVVQNWYFRKFWPKSRYLKIFSKTRLLKISIKIAIFRKFWPKSGVFESLVSIEMFKKN